MRRLRAAAILAALSGAACGADAESGASSGDAGTKAGIVEHRVMPSATDPALGGPEHEHYAYVDASVASNGELFVYLPGTGGTPGQATLLLKEAAHVGYHALGVDYVNDVAVADLCADDLDCYGAVRREALDGTDASPLVDVSPANSILNRLVKLLAYLDAQYPDEGWAAFAPGGQLAWGKLAASGHSQGGGHAAYLASLHALARVVMFSSVVDAAEGDPPTPATWVSSPHETPADAYYGLLHTEDDLAPKIEADWAALGMAGALTSVDGAAPPYGGAQKLSTSVSSIAPHSAVVIDSVTPREGDVPVLLDAWRHLLGP